MPEDGRLGFFELEYRSLGMLETKRKLIYHLPFVSRTCRPILMERAPLT
jgi:hypothetical protein